MKPEMLDFFKNNEEGVLFLSQEVNNLKKDMRKRVKTLGEILNISDSQNRKINKWHHKPDRIFRHFGA